MLLIGELHGLLAGVGHASLYSASWKPMMPEPDRAMAQVGVARLGHVVEVVVDDVVEHAHRGAHGLLELGGVETVFADVLRQVDRLPRLQTAISLSLVCSVISVQRLELCTCRRAGWCSGGCRGP
jgi:hypothetical protein